MESVMEYSVGSPISRNPVLEEKICRVPVTKDYIASFMGLGRDLETKAQKCFPDALYEGVSKLVFKIVHKHIKGIYKEEVEDLAQDCWFRVVNKLHLYKKEKGAFTTWCSVVCLSVLKKKFKRNKKRTFIVETPEGLDENRVSSEESLKALELKADMREAIGDLIKKYPKEKEIIVTLFGGISTFEILPKRLNFRDASRELDMPALRISRFFRKEIRPFFLERFKGV